MDESELADLENVGFFWGKAYLIEYDGLSYKATRRGSDYTLAALTAKELRAMIIKDYMGWTSRLRSESMSL